MKLLTALVILIFTSKSYALSSLTVAFSLDKPPYVMSATESGIEVEIIRKVLLDMGYSLVPVFQPPARSLRSLELNRVDAVATTTNEPKFFLTDPYITFQNFAWTLRSRNLQIKTMADLSKYRVIAFQNAKDFLGPDYENAMKTNPNYQEYAEQNRQILMLLSDRTDVIICEERVFKLNKKNVEVSSSKLIPEIEKHPLFKSSKYSVAFHDPKLRDSFNKVFRKLEAHNAFEGIYKKYASE